MRIEPERANREEIMRQVVPAIDRSFARASSAPAKSPFSDNAR
jgi:hypothetical protein